MDKEKEVKRYDFCAVNDNSDSGAFEEENGHWVKYSNWQAERTKRLLVEKQMEDSIKILESQLATANAKIVEFEKHDCEKFIDEGMGCSICSKLHLDLNKAKEIQDHVNWRISSLEAELSTANKKAERLVDVIKRFMSRVEYDWQSQFEQALEEYKNA